jgi:emfourin
VNVSIVRGGGIAGTATRTQLASEALPEEESRRLEELAAAVEPADPGSGPAHPDETLYRVTVDGVTATHTETTLPEPVRALIDFVSERPERQDGLELPGRR